MDATPVTNNAPAVTTDTVPSAEQQAAGPESDDVVDAADVAAEDDDEQVERFYALLDNIRAMRDMLGGTAAGRIKRAREAEPPWRPAFRMEDFELEVAEEVDSDSAACAVKKKKKTTKRERERESGAKRPATEEEEEEKEEEEEEGEVVEANGPRRGQPQPHKARRAGVVLRAGR